MSANDTPIVPCGGSSTPEVHRCLGKRSRDVEEDVQSTGQEVGPWRNFECTDCHASFAKSQDLLAHMTSCHPEKANWRGINNPQSLLRLPTMASMIAPSIGVGNGDQVVASEDVWDVKEKFVFTKKCSKRGKKGDQARNEKINKNDTVDYVLKVETPTPPVDHVVEVEAHDPPLVRRGVDVDLNFPPPEDY